ncbi:MAG: ribonuclease HII [bacterium]
MRNLDRKLWRNNHLVCGVDEVGRGALAGPVVAAAVVLSPGTRIPAVRDSKMLTPLARKYLANVIKRRALAWSIGAAGHRYIDRHNIAQATFYAMRRAVMKVHSRLSMTVNKAPLIVIADGWKIPDLPLPCTGVIHGDSNSLSIASASIIAKVFRDELMIKIDHRFPGYGLAHHKGYATPQHIQAIRQRGVIPIHRRTFEPIKTFVQNAVPPGNEHEPQTH